MTDARLHLPEKIKPHVLLDTETGEVIARLSDDEKANIRQIVAEEIAKVLPVPHKKPDVGIPDCPDCGGWILDEHDVLTPLDTAYRAWWCVCPEKVAAWEKKCKQSLDDLLEAINSPDNEIEAFLAEMSGEEFEALIEKVKVRRGQT